MDECDFVPCSLRLLLARTCALVFCLFVCFLLVFPSADVGATGDSPSPGLHESRWSTGSSDAIFFLRFVGVGEKNIRFFFVLSFVAFQRVVLSRISCSRRVVMKFRGVDFSFSFFIFFGFALRPPDPRSDRWPPSKSVAKHRVVRTRVLFHRKFRFLFDF